MSTWNGFGTKFYGRADQRDDGSYVTTRWMVALMIPYWPLESMRVKPLPPDKPWPWGDGVDRFLVLERLPRSVRQVLIGYGVAILVVGILFLASLVPSDR